MNCPKCGWPGLIGGSQKQRIAELERHLETANRVRREDNEYFKDKATLAEAFLLLARDAETSADRVRHIQNGLEMLRKLEEGEPMAAAGPVITGPADPVIADAVRRWYTGDESGHD